MSQKILIGTKAAIAPVEHLGHWTKYGDGYWIVTDTDPPDEWVQDDRAEWTLNRYDKAECWMSEDFRHGVWANMRIAVTTISSRPPIMYAPVPPMDIYEKLRAQAAEETAARSVIAPMGTSLPKPGEPTYTPEQRRERHDMKLAADKRRNEIHAAADVQIQAVDRQLAADLRDWEQRCAGPFPPALAAAEDEYRGAVVTARNVTNAVRLEARKTAEAAIRAKPGSKGASRRANMDFDATMEKANAVQGEAEGAASKRFFAVVVPLAAQYGRPVPSLPDV